MSVYGKEIIGKLMEQLKNKVEVITIDVFGCNKEVVRLGAEKVFKGDNFQELNDQIAVYADILVIIEGSRNSGTLLLANNFVQKGKLVYCVPGRINDDSSWACNWLISQGAIPLIEISQIGALV